MAAGFASRPVRLLLAPSRLTVDALHSEQYPDSRYERARRWRDATRELVLTGATAIATAAPPQWHGPISITLTGNALSNDVLLADTGNVVLTSPRDHAGDRRNPMRVVPIRLDMLSDLPAIHVVGRGVTAPVQLRLVVELTARNPSTDITSKLRCAYDPVFLDAQTPLAVLDFQPQHRETCSPPITHQK
jgi:hypothetical protein